MSRERDYEYGDEFSETVVKAYKNSGIEAYIIRTGGPEGKRINKIFGDIVINTPTATYPVEAKRNCAISRSSIEDFQGELYIISEKGVLDDLDRIHVVPRRVINKWADTYVKGDPKRKISGRGWTKLPRSGQDGIILSDKELKSIQAGTTLRQHIENLKRNSVH